MFLVVLSLVAFALAVFFGALWWRLKNEDRERSAARVAALSNELDQVTADGSARTVSVEPEFLTHRPAATSGGLVRVVIGVAMAIAVIIVFAMLGATRPSERATAAASPAKSPGLELLSMRHQREGDALTVTGLVRNGGAGSADHLIAVVFAFDRSGNFLTSGRAPIEFLSLAPGDESPFKVSVPDAGNVGRYRVSFRTDAGVVRHVDRRQSLLARQSE